MTASPAETRERLRKALLAVYVAEAGLPLEFELLLDQLTQPAPPPPRAGFLARARRALALAG